jgi:hypothetical protein
MNEYTSVASADHTADTTYNTPIHNNVGRRPNRSVGHPPTSDPTTVPYNADAIATPCIPALKSHSFWIVCSAPDITTVSNPNRNPARADVSDQKKTLLEWLLPEECAAGALVPSLAGFIR